MREGTQQVMTNNHNTKPNKSQIKAYQKQGSFRTGRHAEIYALRTMAKRLMRSTGDIKKEVNPKTIETFKKDLKDNQRIWTFFQISLIKNDTNVQEPLRTQLLTLCAFVDHRTLDILSTPIVQFDPSTVDMLIQINQEIAGGLEDIDKIAASKNQEKTRTQSNESNDRSRITIA